MGVFTAARRFRAIGSVIWSIAPLARASRPGSDSSGPDYLRGDVPGGLIAAVGKFGRLDHPLRIGFDRPLPVPLSGARIEPAPAVVSPRREAPEPGPHCLAFEVRQREVGLRRCASGTTSRRVRRPANSGCCAARDPVTPASAPGIARPRRARRCAGAASARRIRIATPSRCVAASRRAHRCS